jgi:hypothetical protein
VVALPAAAILSDRLLTMLDCKEQQQASAATMQAVRGGVGTEVASESETRPKVSGVSKVTAKQELADGSQCLTVTDVVIVEGEETSVPKKMWQGERRKRVRQGLTEQLVRRRRRGYLLICPRIAPPGKSAL